MKNWRCITLLNLNYKLMAKVLTERFKSVIGVVIYKDQLCTVLGQQIDEALLQPWDTLWYQWERGLDITVLNLNPEKAFNRVSH